jgi:hypothetical protein
MSKYEVQEYCLFGGWTNTWTTDDEPTIYDTWEEANAGLKDFFRQMNQSFKNGEIEDVPDEDEFRIEEVEND